LRRVVAEFGAADVDAWWGVDDEVDSVGGGVFLEVDGDFDLVSLGCGQYDALGVFAG
jgi:hypothetical protein